MTRIPVIASVMALLAACGGGGDEAGDTTNYNALAAWTAFLTAGHAWNATGVGTDGKTYTVQVGTTPVGNASFPFTGARANRLDVSVTLRQGGATVGSQLTQLYFDDTERVLGSADNLLPQSCAVVTGQAQLPSSSALIGNGGPLYTANLLDGCASNSPVLGTETASWSVELEDGIRYFCINSVQRNAGGSAVSSESDCIEINAAGQLLQRVRIGVETATFSLVART